MSVDRTFAFANAAAIQLKREAQAVSGDVENLPRSDGGVARPPRVVAVGVKGVAQLRDEHQVPNGSTPSRRFAGKPGVVALPLSLLGLAPLYEDLLGDALLVIQAPYSPVLGRRKCRLKFGT